MFHIIIPIRMSLMGHAAQLLGMTNSYKFVTKIKGRECDRLRYTWEDTAKIAVTEIGNKT
jgi:hypothetical protein